MQYVKCVQFVPSCYTRWQVHQSLQCHKNFPILTCYKIMSGSRKTLPISESRWRSVFMHSS